MSQEAIQKRFSKEVDCMHQLQVRENLVGFEKALGAVKVINKVKFNTGLRASST